MATQKLNELGSLWKKTSKNNQTYLTGVINLKSVGFDKNVDLIIFKNDRKTDKQPDFRIYFREPRAENTTTSAPTSTPAKTIVKKLPVKVTPIEASESVEVDDELI